MLTITRKLEFDYGHRVLGHEGKCRYLHGHRGVAEITVTAPDLDSIGRVIDFGVIKKRVGGWIDQWWDHNLLLNHQDPQLDHLLLTEDRKPYIFVEGNPTAEIMAKHLFEMAVIILPELKVDNVRIWETPNSYADYSDNKDGGD